jgi:hypothetical protein
LQSRWCWAASIQIVLNYHGLSINQTDIVAQLYGSTEVNKGADEVQILETLSSWDAFQNGKKVKILAKGGLQSPQDLIAALAYKWPLIVGLSDQEEHHALVLTGIEYAIIPPNNQLLPLRVRLYDPWPNAPTFQEIDWQEFQQKCSAAIKIMLVR